MAIAPNDAAAKPPAAGASVASRFGEITPAFTAAFGTGSTLACCWERAMPPSPGQYKR